MVAKTVITNDFKSLQDIDGDDIKDRYSLAYQYSHITRERDSLLHEDRLESVALGIQEFFADMLGIVPWQSARQREEERMEDELMRLLGEDPGSENAHGGVSQRPGAVRGGTGPSRVR